jgi:hypothetical protein
VSAKEAVMANRVNKKSRKREKQLKKVQVLVKVSPMLHFVLWTN